MPGLADASAMAGNDSMDMCALAMPQKRICGCLVDLRERGREVRLEDFHPVYVAKTRSTGRILQQIAAIRAALTQAAHRWPVRLEGFQPQMFFQPVLSQSAQSARMR